MPKSKDGPSVFVSYSHKDQRWLQRFQVMLDPLVRNDDVTLWADTKLKPGDRWREEIQLAISSADVAVLLVSPHFLASDFIAENELPPILAAAQIQGLRVIWFSLTACLWERTQLADYHAPIDPEKPLDQMSTPKQNKALKRICQEIAKPGPFLRKVARTQRRRSSPGRSDSKGTAPAVVEDALVWKRRQDELERLTPTAGQRQSFWVEPETGGQYPALLVLYRGGQREDCTQPILGLQCITTNLDDDNNFKGNPNFQIRLGEALPRAFIARSTASKEATRFLLRFYDVPHGVRVAIPGFVASDDRNLVACLIEGASPQGDGGHRIKEVGPREVTIRGGFGHAVYEVLLVNPAQANKIWIGVMLGWRANTPNDLPAVGTVRASACIGPISDTVPAGPGTFVDTGFRRNIFTIARCTTALLFPFVTSQVGWDTSIAISNTSRDPLGTPAQAGPVTLYYYGVVENGQAPPTQTSVVIPAGGQLVFTLATGNPAFGIVAAPGFQGYLFALCQFQFADGFAIVRGIVGSNGEPEAIASYTAQKVPVCVQPGQRQPP